MTVKPRAWLVSSVTTDEMNRASLTYGTSNYRQKPMDDLIGAVGNEMRDVKFFNVSSTTAVVYREGDIFALGEIGYRNTTSKGKGDLSYYVQSRRISNSKYRDSSWQHFIVSTKVLKNAVKAASTHLVPFTTDEAVDATKGPARDLVNEAVAKKNTDARNSFRDMTGYYASSSDMCSDFYNELRGHKFISPAINEAAERFYTLREEWKDAQDAMKKGLYFVGITDSCGEQFASMAHAHMGYPYSHSLLSHVPTHALEDWVKGRLAVLSMVPAKTYVQGVGLKLDDRVFYVAGEDN